MTVCWKAAALIALCLGYVPKAGSTVTVERSCVGRFSAASQSAARACALEHGVSYRVRD